MVTISAVVTATDRTGQTGLTDGIGRAAGVICRVAHRARTIDGADCTACLGVTIHVPLSACSTGNTRIVGTERGGAAAVAIDRAFDTGPG